MTLTTFTIIFHMNQKIKKNGPHLEVLQYQGKCYRLFSFWTITDKAWFYMENLWENSPSKVLQINHQTIAIRSRIISTLFSFRYCIILLYLISMLLFDAQINMHSNAQRSTFNHSNKRHLIYMSKTLWASMYVTVMPKSSASLWFCVSKITFFIALYLPSCNHQNTQGCGWQ